MNQMEMEMINDVTKLEKLHGDLSITTRLRLDQFLDSLKPSTRLTYRSTLINFLYRLKSSNPLQLRQYNLAQWDQYVSEYLSTFSNKTINNKAYAVKAFFEYLIEIGERKSNPLEGFVWLQESSDNESRHVLTWEQISLLKATIRDKTYEVFIWGYEEGRRISETGHNGSYVDYHSKLLGKQIGIESLKYSDITAARKRFYATCPVTHQYLEMTEENWIFKNGLLQFNKNK
ncbi:hypothetical protein BC351_00660 [Paenibacillus ferrarius]|uniref:Core-binding (CB) domain-containing protein n=1 Tax=Paenibacillus ferrarius TaxID=1469647 RepID=A0A1V4HS64_9BACL|nr:site-specific integrase [Paenibacillus ferrarius]OPH61784.1 hypothetical protein BC351_00660 [Paenibacillus ferrarius]